MGFSVSAAAAVVFAGLFLAFGVFFGATSNSFERVTDAQDGQTDRVVDQRNTDIEIVSAEYVVRNDSANRLTVLVNNTGAAEVGLDRTDVLLDNSYLVGFRDDATVAGDGETTLWFPGEQLNVTVEGVDQPDRVKVVTERGVADTTTNVTEVQA